MNFSILKNIFCVYVYMCECPCLCLETRVQPGCHSSGAIHLVFLDKASYWILRPQISLRLLSVSPRLLSAFPSPGVTSPCHHPAWLCVWFLRLKFRSSHGEGEGGGFAIPMGLRLWSLAWVCLCQLPPPPLPKYCIHSGLSLLPILGKYSFYGLCFQK